MGSYVLYLELELTYAVSSILQPFYPLSDLRPSSSAHLLWCWVQLTWSRLMYGATYSYAIGFSICALGLINHLLGTAQLGVISLSVWGNDVVPFQIHLYVLNSKWTLVKAFKSESRYLLLTPPILNWSCVFNWDLIYVIQRDKSQTLRVCQFCINSKMLI